jgi:hypothetical protein
MAATLHVCAGCAYKQLGPALAAAHNGDTIDIAQGTYTGGLPINVSVTLAGAGAGETVIAGSGGTGRSVLTIGAYGAATEPTVSIDGMTITGGVATSSPEGSPNDPVAAGGGIEIPPDAAQVTDEGAVGPGRAIVTITNSEIAGNQAAPNSAARGNQPCIQDQPCCPPDHRCPLAYASGGGIDNWGALTLRNSAVTNNRVAGAASDADGGGISSLDASLVLDATRVTGNQAIATDPNGRYAEGAGLFVDGGTLSITDSDVSRNSATLSSSLVSPFSAPADSACPTPCHIDMKSNGGGILVGGDAILTKITNSSIDDNSVRTTNRAGEGYAIDAGIDIANGPLRLRNSRVEGNVSADATGTASFVGPSGSAVEVDGPAAITNTDILNNSATDTSPDDAQISNGLAVLPGDNPPPLVTVTDSRITGNSSTATGGNSAEALGGGVFNNGNLTLRGVEVSGNSLAANGPQGVSQGGGIWNGAYLVGPPVDLALQDSSVTENTLTGSSGITLQGGGLFTPGFPITLTDTPIEHNAPDQCDGC